ncbi:MAG TPA: hypothetical protein PKD72_04945 [Gemmatales bacterium]|nr:hypothetical protein [Gemmatales bacterium]
MGDGLEQFCDIAWELQQGIGSYLGFPGPSWALLPAPTTISLTTILEMV